MESMKYDWTTARGQTCKDKDALPRFQPHSSPPAAMAWDTTYSCDAEDLELSRKRRELQLIEEQIARKKASIAFRKNELQRTTLHRENDKKVDKEEEWNRQMETDIQHDKPPTNNWTQRPPHLTERQIGILNELTRPHVSAFEPSDPAPYMKSFVEKRNAEILQRDLKEKRTPQLHFNATLTPEHKVEDLRPHRYSEHTLPSPGYKPSDPAPFMKSFVEKRNAEILQRDLKEKRTPQLHFNATLTPEHKVEDLRPHRYSEHALPPPGYKSPTAPPDPFSVDHSPGTSNNAQSSKGFSRFLSILNQGVDLGRLSDIVNADQAGAVDNKSTPSVHGETRRSVDLDRNDSRDKHRESRAEEWGLGSKRGDSGVDDGHLKDKDRQSRHSLGDSEEKDGRSTGRRSGSRDSHRHSGDRKITTDWRETDRGWDSRERDRSWDSREEDRIWDSRERDRDARHRRLESRDGYWDPQDRDNKPKKGDWDREWGGGDRESKDRRRDSQSPSRRYSRDGSRRSKSRSPSPVSSSAEYKTKTEKREQFSRIQSLLQTVGLELGIDDVDRLNSRTQERLYGVKHPRNGAQVEYRQQRQNRDDSSHSTSLDNHSPDSPRRRRDSQETSGDVERPRRVSGSDCTHSTECSADGNPVGPAARTIPVSTLSQPPAAHYSSYTVMHHNSCEGQYLSASVQSWTPVGWNGVLPSYGPPQYPPPPTPPLPPQTPIHLPPPQLPQSPIHLPPPPLPQPQMYLPPPPPQPQMYLPPPPTLAQPQIHVPPPQPPTHLSRPQSLLDITLLPSSCSLPPPFPLPTQGMTSHAEMKGRKENEKQRCLSTLKEVPLMLGPIRKKRIRKDSTAKRRALRRKNKRAAYAAAAAAKYKSVAGAKFTMTPVAPEIREAPVTPMPAVAIAKPAKPVIVLRLKSGDVVGASKCAASTKTEPTNSDTNE